MLPFLSPVAGLPAGGPGGCRAPWSLSLAQLSLLPAQVWPPQVQGDNEQHCSGTIYDPISTFTMLPAVNLIKDPVLDMLAFHISLV